MLHGVKKLQQRYQTFVTRGKEASAEVPDFVTRGKETSVEVPDFVTQGKEVSVLCTRLCYTG